MNQLVSLGWLERKHQKGRNGEQGSNLYKVTIWHLANVPEPSINGRGKSCTPAKYAMPPVQNLHPPIAPNATKQDVYKLDTNNNINKVSKQKTKKKIYSKEFELFWEKYLKIKKRASGQTKPKAYDHYCVIIKNHSPESLALALQRAITDQHQIEIKGGFASPFPNCCRWLKDGFYEAYLPSTVDLPKPKQNWEKDKSQDSELPF